jgi:hypothetical protein
MHRRAWLALGAVVLAGACNRTSMRANGQVAPQRHNPLGLGAPWSVVTRALGPAAAPAVVTPTGVTGAFGACPVSGAAAYEVTADALHAEQPVDDQPVVEIDGSACGAPVGIGHAQAEALRFFPDLSGVVLRRDGAIVYQSQPLIRLVPPAAFFTCQALGASGNRLGRFSLRLDATGWKLEIGDCTTDAPPGSPNAVPSSSSMSSRPAVAAGAEAAVAARR